MTPGSPMGPEESRPSGRAPLVATDGHNPTDGIVEQAAPGIEGITPRVRIRKAALKHFAEEGSRPATIGALRAPPASRTGCSDITSDQRSTCAQHADDYAFQVLHRLNALMHETPSTSARSFHSSKQIWRYAARSLADTSPTAAPIFDEMVTITARRMVRADGLCPEQAAAQDTVRTALLAAMATTIPLFHEHLSRALGVDIFAPEGDRLVTQAVLDILAHQLNDDDPASVPLAGAGVSSR